MTIRFFVLSAHYRGTVDFSNDALVAAEKGLEKLMNAIQDLDRLSGANSQAAALSGANTQAAALSGTPSHCDGQQCDPETERIVKSLRQKCYDAMNDDFATPLVISNLFEACTVVNRLVDHKATICSDCLKELHDVMHLFAEDILGLKPAAASGLAAGNGAAREQAFGKVMDMVLELRAKPKADKDWATSDKIRDELAAAGFEVKDTKDGVTWKLNI